MLAALSLADAGFSAGDAPLDAGTEFRLPTTTRVYNQLDDVSSDESCGAHAVATAMETVLVERNPGFATTPLIDAVQLFHNAGDARSLRRCYLVAAGGVATPMGI